MDELEQHITRVTECFSGALQLMLPPVLDSLGFFEGTSSSKIITSESLESS